MSPSPPITLCGSLSMHPVPLGAAMHNAGYRALGLDFTYVPFAMTEEQLPAALQGMRALGIRGFGVSMPFKLSVIPLLDELDPLAERIGAVNTIVNDDGTLRGHNTDAEGAVRAIEEVTSVRGTRVLLVGAGGAARAVLHGLLSAGAEVHLVNRSPDKIEVLAREAAAQGWKVTTQPLAELRDAGDFPIVVNASSAGHAGHGSAPVDVTTLRESQVVMDAVYKPLETDLVRGAREAGARAIHGGRMLLHQACRQFEHYTGQPAPLAAMDAALRRFVN